MARFRVSPAKIAKAMEKYGDTCYLCGLDLSDSNIREITERLDHISAKLVCSLDHVISVRDGGTNDIENLRPAHYICNMAKSFMTLEEFRWFSSLWSKAGE